MQITSTKRKTKCKDCQEEAKFKLVLGKTNIYLCPVCLKQIYKARSQTMVPNPVSTKFYLKR